MKQAMIADLKNRLSHYLRFVRAGESVLVLDRGTPIARIEPVRAERGPGDDPGWTDDLTRSGVLRGPTKSLKSTWLRDRPRSTASVVDALLNERRSSR